ncbi:MAG: protein translocase subunit SecD [Patescibacteria group bacterium]|jgi:preprotein translocase subunit SecD
MKRTKRLFWLILLLSLICLYLNLPEKLPLRFSFLGLSVDKELSIPHPTISFLGISIPTAYPLRLGMDLAGGSHLVFETEVAGRPVEEVSSIEESLRENIRRRVDLYGVSEARVETAREQDNLRLIVELPGVEETEEAVALIGQTAQLDFRRQIDEASPSAGFVSTDLTGADLKKAGIDFDPTTGEPLITLEFSPEGREKFARLTEETVGQILAIFLDEMPLSLPVVEEPIKEGNAVIKGEFSLEEARKLVAQMNAGALPVSLKLVEQRTVEASLGQEAVRQSLWAGAVGILAVMIFMFAYYGKLGLIADLALLIYGLLTLTLYRLIPVTLTLPGIAGLILSIGMAVDANILIFERLREEQRQGKEGMTALELAFGRAWDSIRDANACTIITAFILLNPFDWSFFPTAGMIRGFALTLGLGVVLSLFTGVVVSRTLIRVLGRGKAHGVKQDNYRINKA